MKKKTEKPFVDLGLDEDLACLKLISEIRSFVDEVCGDIQKKTSNDRLKKFADILQRRIGEFLDIFVARII
jgi:hypothetical protein